MIPELGHFALILALCLAIVQATLPILGSFNGNRIWMYSGKSAAYGQLCFVGISFLALVYAFLNSDFSVLYVANNSNTQLPDMYKISAVWGAHEGSLLLWVLMLAGWGAAVAHFSEGLPDVLMARVLSIMGWISIGFMLFILLTSNPFERLDFMPAEGRDLNPLLQDPGLAVHPPLLYMGYVGLSVVFSFAIAALIGGRLDAAWARWSRPWTTFAWLCLTLGITLGSWWAYNELGWGGWWFWDPVENASLMPWLVATALIHSLAMTEKRGAFKSWTVLLAIMGFSLSLLGTFLVRSGVLNSVHAFASDPARGVYILMFLLVVIGGSLSLYAWRGPSISKGGSFSWLSRESFLLGNNLILVSVTGFILFGTLAPLIYEAMGWGKISVGFPWFNSLFVVFMPFLGVLLGIGPISRWKENSARELFARLRVSLIVSLLVTALFAIPLLIGANFLVCLGVLLASWIVCSSLQAWYLRSHDPRGLWFGLRKLSRSYYAMLLAHLGVAVFIIGITFVSNYEIETDVGMRTGESIQLANYEFRFERIEELPGPNYLATRAYVQVYQDNQFVVELSPEKRRYQVQTQAMTEASVDAGWLRDLYVSLGEPLGAGAWSLRFYYKPMIRWIWAGGLLMVLGGLLAVSDKRYRLSVRKAAATKADDAVMVKA